MRITKIVDLSVLLGPSTVIYPGDPEPVFREHATIDGDGFNVLEVHMGSQTGTHVDAPRHFVSSGTPIDGLDLSRFMGTGVVIDVTGLAPRARITLELVASALPLLGPKTIVLLQTGWEMHYETSLWFAHPFLDPPACAAILETGVRTILLDVMNIDETPDDDHRGDGFPCHHLIAAVEGVIGENLCNFAAIDWPSPFISALPLRMVEADGAPVRAVALELAWS